MVVVNSVSQDSFENEIGAGCQVCGDLGRCSAAIGVQADWKLLLFCVLYACMRVCICAVCTFIQGVCMYIYCLCSYMAESFVLCIYGCGHVHD